MGCSSQVCWKWKLRSGVRPCNTLPTFLEFGINFFFFLDDLCCLKKLKHLACSPSSIPKLSPPQRGIRQKQSLHCFTPHPNSHSICAQALCVTSNIPPCFSSVLDPHSCPAWSESEREDFQSGFPTPISCKTTFPIPFSLKISDFQRSV